MTGPHAPPPSTDPAASLAAVVALRRRANQLEIEAVAAAMGQGWTWAAVGQALGISAQAAHKKFAATVRALSGTTGVRGESHLP